MHPTHTHRSLLTAALIAALACLGLTACGGSSSSSTTSTTANAAKTSSAHGHSGNGFATIRECLEKSGIKLPQRTPGQPRVPGVGGPLGGPQLPKGMTAAQFQAALQKCSGGRGFGRAGRPGEPGRPGGAGAPGATGSQPGKPGGAGGPAARRHFGSPVFRKALAAFATCMNHNGVKLPAPNTSGTGPVFSTQGLDTTSASFKAASAKCQSVLRSAFPHPTRPSKPAPQ
jgi:hypothetical protein